MAPDRVEVVDLFNRIAPVYDFLNRVISWGQDQRWRRELAGRMQLESGQMALDIAVGTGDMALTLKAACPDITILGLDPSPIMMAGYRRKAKSAPLSLGVAERLPLADESVDRAVCAFGVRNFFDRPAAWTEIRRILKPGGLWGFLEMSAPMGRLFPKIYAFYFKRLVPLIGATFSLTPFAYRYLRDSVYVFPGYDAMKAEHEAAGFRLQFYRPILRGAVGLYVFQKPLDDK
ncbi:MAG TPA: ubiquinone/menaquinone biosynthesis methyltransferase [bacterium]|jgi:demethylmenaquinone methyltransferase/2-methoxy-6-polyprenyl-1,4-benzoquinol methylase